MLTVRGRRTEKHDLLQQNLCLAYVVVAADLAEEPSGVSVCVCVCVVLRRQLLYGAVSCSTCSPSHKCCKTDLRVFSGL